MSIGSLFYCTKFIVQTKFNQWGYYVQSAWVHFIFRSVRLIMHFNPVTLFFALMLSCHTWYSQCLPRMPMVPGSISDQCFIEPRLASSVVQMATRSADRRLEDPSVGICKHSFVKTRNTQINAYNFKRRLTNIYLL